MNSTKPRTTIKLNLPKKNKASNYEKTTRMDFAQCVLHPFDGPNHLLSTVPDGDASNRLLIDHSSYTDFTINSGGSIVLRVMPTLPYNCLYQPGQGTTLTANDPFFGAVTGTAGNQQNSWTPCCFINQHANSTPVNSMNFSTPGVYSQSKVRLISLAWRIIYTGTVSNGNGMLTMRDFPVTYDQVVILGTGGLRFADQLNTSASNSTTANTVAMIDYPVGTGSLDVGKTVFNRLDNNPWGIVKRNSRIYSWGSYYEQPFSLIASTNTNASVITATTTPLLSLVSSTSNKGVVGINYISQDFNSTEISLSSVSQNVSFRIEVKACYEYLVIPSSSIYSLTKSPADPKIDEINAVQQVQSKLPAALTNGTIINNPILNGKSANTTKTVANIKKSVFSQFLQQFDKYFTGAGSPPSNKNTNTKKKIAR